MQTTTQEENTNAESNKKTNVYWRDYIGIKANLYFCVEYYRALRRGSKPALAEVWLAKDGSKQRRSYQPVEVVLGLGNISSRRFDKIFTYGTALLTEQHLKAIKEATGIDAEKWFKEKSGIFEGTDISENDWADFFDAKYHNNNVNRDHKGNEDQDPIKKVQDQIGKLAKEGIPEKRDDKGNPSPVYMIDRLFRTGRKSDPSMKEKISMTMDQLSRYGYDEWKECGDNLEEYSRLLDRQQKLVGAMVLLKDHLDV